MLVELLVLDTTRPLQRERDIAPGDTVPELLSEHSGRGQQESEDGVWPLGWAWSRSREVLKQKIKWSMLTLNNGSG